MYYNSMLAHGVGPDSMLAGTMVSISNAPVVPERGRM